MKHLPVIVIGHVDHGKTSLVQALTGVDTDRLPEEKARGVSILPGFAHLAFEDVQVDFIDAPGHEDYVRAMVSGASGADAVLLVVSAVEGLEAQSIEHLLIAEHLGYKTGLVAITKSDLIADGDRKVCEGRIRRHLADTFLHDAPTVFCSSKTGEGMQALGAELAALHAKGERRAQPQSVFFPIDRVFTSHGVGTIVTGTLLGGTVSVGDELCISPSGRVVTVRSIQTHGRDAVQADKSQRVALNLRDVSAGDIERGDVLHRQSAYECTRACDVEITLSKTLFRPLKHMERIRVLHSAAHTIATVRLYGSKQIAPGARAFARLQCDTPVTLYAGQRIILRSLSPARTLGGGCVLDPVVQRGRVNKIRRLETLKMATSGSVAEIATALAKEGGGVAVKEDIVRIARLPITRFDSSDLSGFKRISDAEFAPVSIIAEVKRDYIRKLDAHHAEHPLKLSAHIANIRDHKRAAILTSYIENLLEAEGKLRREGDMVALKQHSPLDILSMAQCDRMDDIERVLREAGLKPPAPAILCQSDEDTDVLELLIHKKSVIRLFNVSLRQSIVFHADAVAEATRKLKKACPDGAVFTTGEARAILETTRKYVVPLLEYFDEIGVTVRNDDKRHMA